MLFRILSQMEKNQIKVHTKVKSNDS